MSVRRHETVRMVRSVSHVIAVEDDDDEEEEEDSTSVTLAV